MEGSMTWPTVSFLLLVILISTSSGEEVANSTKIEEPVSSAKILADVPSTKAFIESSEIAVIGFIQDPEAPEVKEFNTLISKHPEWDYGLSTSKEVLKHFKIESNTVALFRQVDNKRDDLILKDHPGINTEKLFRFLTINELRTVTDYNAVTAVGLLNSKVQIHMLLFIDKGAQNQEEILKEFREAAVELKGKVLFVKVDVSIRSNEKVMSYFQFKRSDLPRVAIFNSENETKKIMDAGPISSTRLRDFCYGFLSGKTDDEESDKKEVKTEL
ncbi:hypothetical protein XENTR_v10012672 [Xenopus tropicalis]|uniref:Endoplasmic reticulum protein 27 n=1 Tax=Xenopus tropicalis TaxID=8364 RepID=A0A6I8Q662_XENTR|nr:endoplasmic reticulum resident protein 27 [Xenopus tropicalis]KAE8612010.1 hypothetical protein XENTR_v10012672 [Xenopus tropicalis]|eukprot:XP_002935653.1 PREDICTED: endoplasmic reticulum resident protein 27 [Xenopus tropicalis]